MKIIHQITKEEGELLRESNAAYEHEVFIRKSFYEYRCCKCLVKRKTTKRSVAKKGVCNACVKKRIIEEEDKRQIKMFD